eukprot:257023_1
MWYIQINNNYPQKMIPCENEWSKKNNQVCAKSQTDWIKADKWTFQIKYPENLKIFYVFTQNTVKASYNVTVQIGSLPEFYLGTLDMNNQSIQSEPNFVIQRGTNCFVTVQKNIKNKFGRQNVVSNEQQLKKTVQNQWYS